MKIILTNKVQFEAGHQYNIVVDFDAMKSVVVQGNGRCLLKPVLKLKSALKVPIVTDPGSGGETPTDPGTGGETPTDPGTGGGETPTDPGTGTNPDDGSSGGGEVVTDPGTGTDPGTNPDDGSNSGGGEVVTDPGTGSGGEELVTNPDQNSNDPSTDDGWDYTPIVDGQDYPVVTQDQLGSLL